MDTSRSDDVRIRAEIDRLLSQANLQRLRGEFIPAEDTCKQVLEMDPGNLKARILLADLLHERGKLEDAAAAYKALMEEYPTIAVLEESYARVVLEIGERDYQKLIMQDMIDNPSRYAKPERSSLMAVILSFMAPGFGHIYLGEYVKGLTILGIFVFSLLVIVLSPGTFFVARQLGDYMRHPTIGINYSLVSPLAVLFTGVGVFTYIYGLIDTAVIAGKSGKDSLT